MIERKPAEVFPPGDFIKEEIEERGWSQIELAEIMGCYPADVSGLISGKRSITPEIAKALGSAFGVSAQYWMNLESTYRLHKAGDADDAIARRSRLYAYAPVREMVKRNWIEASENIDVLEHSIKRFFGVSDLLDEPISFAHAARRGKAEITPAQRAWLHRARQLAHAVHAEPFSNQSFANGVRELRQLLPSAQGVRRVPKILADAGIRFLVVESLPKAGIDGVTFWLDKRSPVVVLSLRYDRIDSFWFTLFHELAHVSRRDGLTSLVMIDTDLVGDDALPNAEGDVAEIEASRFATEHLVSQSEIDNFIARVSPLYLKARIINFATRIGVHPGIVVGQLQHRNEISYSAHRQLLDKVRSIITQSALTDGWGDAPYIQDEMQNRLAG
ncbi:MAG: helix-turn-helix domain-containing protein [Armatimonadota bacterium]|nr:helix-turn-helix domain-containing protein [Armatimonadota bacterium]